MKDSGAVKIDLLTEDHRARTSEMGHALRSPRDAASLILMDRSTAVPRALLGKRGKGHAFMPDLYVFPGGRRDPGDNRTPLAQPLRDEVAEKLMQRTRSRFQPYAARGLAVAAAREMEEEAHLSLTPPDCAGGLCPDVSHFRYLARAITPPGQSRRFDTRFFACFCDELGLDPKAIRDSHELHDLTWLPIDAHDTHPLPRITRVILTDLAQALEEDPSLPFGRAVPFYYFRNGRFVRELI
ncbi:MAG: hydrolase [Hoeflea sp.]|uniref:NUDIX hydrolase n=1 Tax=Hoeflea sp. TaxID=1940281 RepID=UPI0027316FED|nr:hydrolase [Hoeflea sp.]MDP2120930.1 hydrolase [Hoeflea sp.]MDP3527332.1 hydrolase [Hoeflea sp.]MDZ7601685.1 hydrolase [Hoeflea sp.]